MKKINKKIILAVMVSITALMSGCSTTLAVMGMDGESAGGKLRESKIKFSKEENVTIKKNKAYVVLISGKKTASDALYEDIEGKLTLVAKVGKKPGKAIVEIDTGKHIYVSSSACGAHTIEINAQKGKIYYIQDVSIEKLSLMSYCRAQGAFQFFKNIVPSETFKDFTNYTLVEKNIDLANELIFNSSLPSKYERFKEDKESVHKRLRIVFPQKYAAIIK